MSQPEPKPADVLAQKRTDLAADRTLWAAERTSMAWVRTGLSMIGFGFTIYKVLQAMLKEGIMLTPRPQGAKYLGLFLIGLGALAAFMGTLDFWQVSKSLHKQFGTKLKWFPLVMSSLIFAMGMWLFVSIILKAELF